MSEQAIADARQLDTRATNVSRQWSPEPLGLDTSAFVSQAEEFFDSTPQGHGEAEGHQSAGHIVTSFDGVDRLSC
jgi:hypothetical protein